MKKMAICLIFLLVTASVFALESKGTDLLRACRIITRQGVGAKLPIEEATLGSYYSGYLLGFLNASVLVQLKSKDPLYCLPEEGITSEHFAFLMENYLDKHPDKLHFPNYVLVHAALSELYPCK